MLKLIPSLSFMCLLMAISTMAQSPRPVLDTDGEPLKRGEEYYVGPGITDVAGGLTLVARNGSCPFYVGQVPIGSGNLRGLEVTFTPRNPNENIITESTDFTVAFSASSTCVRNTAWRIGEEDEETRRRFIVTGGEPDYFQIRTDQVQGSYTFFGCPTCRNGTCTGRPRCGTAGILEKNGTRFLALDGPPFPFIFIED